jgi:hypothetical protein
MNSAECCESLDDLILGTDNLVHAPQTRPVSFAASSVTMVIDRMRLERPPRDVVLIADGRDRSPSGDSPLPSFLRFKALALAMRKEADARSRDKATDI